MKLKLFKIIIFFFVLCVSCNYNNCKNIDDWIDYAPEALDEFLLVKKEVLSNEEFLNEFTIKGNLFLNNRDTSKYTKYNLLYLKEWFRNGRGYISLNQHDTSFCFKECESGSYTTAGYIYYNRQSSNYKSTVQIIDSSNLGSGWFAHIIECKGCND